MSFNCFISPLRTSFRKLLIPSMSGLIFDLSQFPEIKNCIDNKRQQLLQVHPDPQNKKIDLPTPSAPPAPQEYHKANLFSGTNPGVPATHQERKKSG